MAEDSVEALATIVYRDSAFKTGKKIVQALKETIPRQQFVIKLQAAISGKIIAGEIPSHKVYEDDSVIAFLDINPVSEGHTLVVPKDHFEKFNDCSDTVAEAIGPQILKISRAVSTAVGADGYNLLCNNGRAAGQLVGHVHFHIIPLLR